MISRLTDLSLFPPTPDNAAHYYAYKIFFHDTASWSFPREIDADNEKGVTLVVIELKTANV